MNDTPHKIDLNTIGDLTKIRGLLARSTKEKKSLEFDALGYYHLIHNDKDIVFDQLGRAIAAYNGIR